MKRKVVITGLSFLVLLSAGVGITPMMSVARYLTETRWPGKVALILGFRAPRDLYFSRGN